MTPQQIATMTTGALQGIPQGEIANQIGVRRETVNRNLQRPEIRAKIEAEAAQIINRGLSQARRTITRLAAQGNVKGADKDTLKLALDASKHITAIAGLSGGTPGTIINTLIQINQDPEHQAELTNVERFLQMEAWQHEQVDNKYPSGYKVSSEGEVIDVTPSHTPAHVQPVNIPGNGDAGEVDGQPLDASDRSTNAQE